MPRQHPVQPIAAQLLAALVLPDAACVVDLVVEHEVVEWGVVDRGDRVDVGLHQVLGHRAPESHEFIVVTGHCSGLGVGGFDLFDGDLAQVDLTRHADRAQRIPSALGKAAYDVGVRAEGEEGGPVPLGGQPLQVVVEGGAEATAPVVRGQREPRESRYAGSPAPA
jgi:hypothetical protein